MRGRAQPVDAHYPFAWIVLGYQLATDDELEQAEQLGLEPQALAAVVLLRLPGVTSTDVAQVLGVSPGTVRSWRSRLRQLAATPR